MKSLLVDALRQAQGSDSATRGDGENPAAQNRNDATADGGPVTSGALQRQVDSLGLVATGQFDALGGDLNIDAAAGGQDSDFAEQDGTTSSAVTLPPNELRNESLPRSKPLMARIGRLTPILCLLAMALTAILYLLIARFAAVGLNNDLHEISARVQQNDVAGPAAGWREQPVTEINVFNRLAESGQQPDATVRNAPAESPLAGSTPVSASEAADATEPPPVLVTAEGIDRAFSSVRAGYDAYLARDYSLAEEHYRQALAIEPNHHDALLGLAAVLQRTSRNHSALQSYEKLLALDPGSTRAAAAILAIRAGSSGRDSESDLKVLLQRFPQAPHLHFTLASIYAEQGRWPQAQFEFQAAHRLAPGNADYSYNLAVSMERIGDYGGARRYFEIAQQSAGENSGVDPATIAAHLEALAEQLGEQP